MLEIKEREERKRREKAAGNVIKRQRIGEE